MLIDDVVAQLKYKMNTLPHEALRSAPYPPPGPPCHWSYGHLLLCPTAASRPPPYPLVRSVFARLFPASRGLVWFPACPAHCLSRAGRDARAK
jgi:hypothetical protein